MKTKILTLLFAILIIGTINQVAGQPGTNNELSDHLIEAISAIDMVSLNVLLADGANIDTVDQKGNTPLMIAAKVGNPRIVKILLAHNPDLNLRNHEGNSALMIAAEHGQTHIMEQLIQQGADLNAKNANGFSILEIAKRNGHAAAIHILNKKDEMLLMR